MLDFHLKAVTFLGRPCSIVCQNENGPCPLLAIANVLLLQDRMNIHSDRGVISLPELTQLVANTILEGRDQLSVEGAAMVECVLNILPKLAQGLDLNVFFDSVSKFEFTEEISVFDSLNIPLFHGWLVDDADYPTAEVVKGMSYNHLLFKLVEYKSLCDKLQDSTRHQDSLSDEEKSLLDTGGYLEQFFNSTATQLTNKGVQELYKIITDRQLAVFFRNNHFSTIFSYEGQLFLLMTDQGFLTVPNVVWEILDGIDGYAEYSNFSLSANHFYVTLQEF